MPGVKLTPEAEILKLGVTGVVTVRVSVAVCAVPLEGVPVTVIVYVPVAAELLAVKVSVVVPAPVSDVGLKAAVTPAGIPLAE
jgi:hypothetical protein